MNSWTMLLCVVPVQDAYYVSFALVVMIAFVGAVVAILVGKLVETA